LPIEYARHSDDYTALPFEAFYNWIFFLLSAGQSFPGQDALLPYGVMCGQPASNQDRRLCLLQEFEGGHKSRYQQRLFFQRTPPDGRRYVS
jgi:hypothetical protein